MEIQTNHHNIHRLYQLRQHKLQHLKYHLCFIYLWQIIYFLTENNLVISVFQHIFYSISSSSSSRAVSMGFSDPLLPPVSIIHCFRQVFRAKSCIGTELLSIDLSWSSYLCSSMWRGPLERITYELVLTSPAVSYMFVSFNLDSFHDRW